MITLTLLHPLQDIPVQSWSFEDDQAIRIGRATDNHVILYSAVVSRHHVEIRQINSTWEAINLGTNGTYLDGKRISQAPLENGAVIRLARSGPKIQVRIGQDALALKRNTPSARPISASSEANKDTLLIDKDKNSDSGEISAQPPDQPVTPSPSLPVEATTEMINDDSEPPTHPDLNSSQRLSAPDGTIG